MSDSTAAGILPPVTPGPEPLEDQALDRFLQQYVAALTGIDGALVRPRWQTEPPNQPDIGTTWIALGVSIIRGDTNAAEIHAADGAASTIYRNEELEVLISTFGPGAGAAWARLRDGLAVEQNRAYLSAAGFGLIELTDCISAPAFINERWQRRLDSTLRLRRGVTRRFPVLSLAALDATTHE